MPDLDFQVAGVEPASNGLTPLLHFKLRITGADPQDQFHAVLLNAQIQIQPAQRAYTPDEQAKLVELFGEPKRWSETLRNRLWAHTNSNVGAFTGSTEAVLAVPCSFDLNVASAKYFHALEGGEVALLFLFSGTVFYPSPDGRLQVGRISWNKECTFRMPAQTWRDLMDRLYPNSAWLALRRDAFEQLCRYKRERGLMTWEDVIEQLLPQPEPEEVPA
jgi:hypothetical protein